MSVQVNIYTKEHQTEWQNALGRMVGYDFYHTFSYNLYYSRNGFYPLLFSYKENEVEIVIPLIFRKIDGVDYNDVTSSYGYVGPLASQKNIDKYIIRGFLNSLNNFFFEKNVISAFSRMHPSLENEYLLEGLGMILPLSETVYINLKKDLASQKQQFRKGVKSDLSRLNREGYTVSEDQEKAHVDEFIDIYNENMIRVGAKEEYFFDKVYYNTILNSLDINSRLFFVTVDGIRIAGSIFVFTDKIIQYHLSATRNQFLKNSPVRLLIDLVRKIGHEHGYEEFHLGEGLVQLRIHFSDLSLVFRKSDISLKYGVTL